MNRIHDNIKITYVEEGYLPNWPYHLISDEEMMNAFFSAGREGDKLVLDSNCFFANKYPLLDDNDTEMSSHYQDLLEALNYFKGVFLSSISSSGEGCELPNWVYSYMLGTVISVDSDVLDIHDLLVALGKDNIDDIFTKCASSACYEVSSKWVSKQTYFKSIGHMVYVTGKFNYCSSEEEIKSLLRLNSLNVSETFNSEVDTIIIGGTGQDIDSSVLRKARGSVNILYEPEALVQLYRFEVDDKIYYTRPPTLFGEPHVIKSLRLSENPLV